MQNKKLSLAELKEKAKTIENEKVLEKVQGGGWNDCHGFLGGLGKFVRGEDDSIKFDIGG